MAALSAPTMDFSGSPNAPVYAEDAAAAQDAYNKALSNTQMKQSQLYNQAGFKVTNNADGSIANMTPDGLNPTGQYQQLQKAEGQTLEARHEADLSRGIGTTGIAAQPTSDLRYRNAVEQTNFGNNLLNANQGLVDNNTNAFNSYQQTLLNLQLQAISDARANQSFPKESKQPAASNTPPPGAPANYGVYPLGDAAVVQNQPGGAVGAKNATAKSIKVGSTSDVDPKLIALNAAIAASKKKPAAAAPISGYSQKSNSNLH